ncbi:unnamed protein product [Adineta ricciae]|uniref:Uncharacterized protein n=1 Tax=Adineta ricciae TaxID=249248 RepID=A0A816E215_ADIRI|nr:unnamed protein product [Adineta ricciae]
MDDQSLFFTTSSSSFFDTYLVYGIVGLIILIAVLGLVILLCTSCCCCYCCLSSASRSCCCLQNRRHSSYKLRERAKRLTQSTNGDSKKIGFIRRHPSDIADFSQLYDSCPHLVNSKAMTPTGANMETSCTTIDTIVNPVSPCSSFRSFVGSGTLPKENKSLCVQNDTSKLPSQTTTDNKTNNLPQPPTSSTKGSCLRPFSYIKNTNDRAHILRRFTPHERSTSSVAVTLDVTQLPSSLNDDSNQFHSNSVNIYETVLPPANQPSLPCDVPSPIYETEWTHSLRQLMITTANLEKENISIIELPSAPPDLVSSTIQSTDYFQQQNPYDKFLACRSTTSDSMRRTNMLRRLKDDAAFLY